jgi:hypothetical protein
MTVHQGVIALLSASIMPVLFGCAPVVQQQPKPVDPIREQITILQKQLLELQYLQNENRRKVEEQAAIAAALSSKIKALEERQSLAPASLPSSHQITSIPSSTLKAAPVNKKALKKKQKKKKTVRRQEQ